MPTIELSDEELQGLIMLCAQGSGPGITWMLTNAILTKAQQAAQKKPTDGIIDPRNPTGTRKRSQPDSGLGDMLDRNTALPQEH